MNDKTPLRVVPGTAALHPSALIRKPQIIGTGGSTPLLAVGNTRFYELIAKGRFPRPIKIGRASFWRVSEVLAALAEFGEQS